MKSAINTKIWLITLAAALLLVSGAVFCWAAGKAAEKEIFPNVRVEGVDVGGLTREEAAEKLRQTWPEDKTLRITTFRGAEVFISFTKAGLIPEPEYAAEKAWLYGREQGFRKSVAAWFACRRADEPVEVDAGRAPDMAYVEACLDELNTRLTAALGDGEITADKQAGTLTLEKGCGVSLRLDELQAEVLAALSNGETELYFAQTEALPMPDFASVRDSLYTEVSDARYSADGAFTVIPDATGYDLDVSLAQAMWEQAEIGEQIIIPLSVTKPAITAQELESRLYRDLLGAVTTKYNNSGENRSSNVRLAAAKVNGVIILPGEEFSFNGTVGKRTAEAGFLPAPAITGEPWSREEIGGGVCQVSTGLYASALYAFLDITEHRCHVRAPNYIQKGTDATVTIPANEKKAIDLCFRNNKSYPVRITAYCEETMEGGQPLKTVTVELWGTLEENDYMPVEFDNSLGVIFTYDRVIPAAYPDREGYIIKLTHDSFKFEDEYGSGVRTLTHRKVYTQGGTLVEDKIINPKHGSGYFAMDSYYDIQE